MSGEEQKYLDALRAYEVAKEEAGRVCAIVGYFGQALRYGWAEVQFGSMPFQPNQNYQTLRQLIQNASGMRKPVLDMEQWPPAADVRAAIEAAQRLFEAAKTEWDALPAANRVGLHPPSSHMT